MRRYVRLAAEHLGEAINTDVRVSDLDTYCGEEQVLEPWKVFDMEVGGAVEKNLIVAWRPDECAEAHEFVPGGHAEAQFRRVGHVAKQGRRRMNSDNTITVAETRGVRPHAPNPTVNPPFKGSRAP